MENPHSEMALNSYGYGSWKAPYWFIGPEQGQGKNEGYSLAARLAAWKQLDVDGLCDCRDFHDLIPVTYLHCERPKLQPTWRSLMLLLMAFLDKPLDNDFLRAYQRDQWGRLNGETCVIELSGLPANSFKIPRDRDLFREERIKFIGQKLERHKPALLIMYGLHDKESWEKISGCKLHPAEIVKIGPTLAVLTPHPVARGLRKQDWIDLGQNLNRKYFES